MAESAEFPTRYRDVKPRTLREVLRESLLRIAYLSSSVTSGMRSALLAPRLQVLYFHHLFHDEVEGFRKLLKLLSASHVFISYSAAVDLLKSGQFNKPYVAISFDDGFKSHLTAARIMSDLGISGCFFVPTDYVGLSDDARIRDVCRRVFNMPPLDFLNWSDLESMMAMGHEVGSHTTNHVRLSGVPSAEAEASIEESYDVLKSRLGGVQHFAWPYGLRSDITPQLVEFSRNVGFRSVASAERGCHVTAIKQGFIHRDVVSAAAPIHATLYFMARNSKRAAEASR